MIDLAFLKRLIETVESSGIDTLEISRWGTKIRISKSPSGVGGDSIPLRSTAVQAGGDAAQAVSGASANDGTGEATADAKEAEQAPDETEEYTEVTSPMVGTFYRAPAPDAPPYVEIGDHVKKGQTLCILEAMKLMNELESEVDGTIKEICVENAEPVEYGQALFRILPD